MIYKYQERPTQLTNLILLLFNLFIVSTNLATVRCYTEIIKRVSRRLAIQRNSMYAHKFKREISLMTTGRKWVDLTDYVSIGFTEELLNRKLQLLRNVKHWKSIRLFFLDSSIASGNTSIRTSNEPGVQEGETIKSRSRSCGFSIICHHVIV